jgi:hypothetical protein
MSEIAKLNVTGVKTVYSEYAVTKSNVFQVARIFQRM